LDARPYCITCIVRHKNPEFLRANLAACEIAAEFFPKFRSVYRTKEKPGFSLGCGDNYWSRRSPRDSVSIPQGDSTMSKRKHLAARKPCGRLYPARDTELLSPAGTPIGRLYLDGKLTSAQFATAKRWAEMVANYSIACRSPSPPRSLSLDAIGIRPTDPDTATGEREMRRHERASAEYLAGRNALRLAGLEAERVVDHVCARDCALAGFGELLV